MDNMSKKDQEYKRLNDELMMRIKRSYNDGVMLASFYLIYYATVIAAFVQLLIQPFENSSLKFIFFGLMSSIAFCMPIVLLYAFAIKHKENFAGICNISGYIRIYHELPTLSSNINDENEIRWELTHKDTISPTAKFEDKEYFFLSLTSLLSMLASVVITIVIGIECEESVFLMLLIGSICLCSTIISVLFSIKIRRSTNLNVLVAEIDKARDFYERQAKMVNKKSEKWETELEKYKAFSNQEKTIDEILQKIGYSKYNKKVINIFYEKISNDDREDRDVKRVIKKIQKMKNKRKIKEK